jgi:hypothetical protein
MAFKTGDLLKIPLNFEYGYALVQILFFDSIVVVPLNWYSSSDKDVGYS